MPKNFPKAPPPVVAATLAPLAWAWGAPDLFDSYSAGVVLMQVRCRALEVGGAVGLRRHQQPAVLRCSRCWRLTMRPSVLDTHSCIHTHHPSRCFVQLAVPQLRPGVAQRSFNAELAAADYDLNLWRR